MSGIAEVDETYFTSRDNVTYSESLVNVVAMRPKESYRQNKSLCW